MDILSFTCEIVLKRMPHDLPHDWSTLVSGNGLVSSGNKQLHYNDVIMGGIASQITDLTIVYSSVYSGADQRKHQNSILLAFVRGIHWWPVNSPHKWPVTWKIFPFDDVIMTWAKVDQVLWSHIGLLTVVLWHLLASHNLVIICSVNK